MKWRRKYLKWQVLESSVGKMLGGSYSHNAMIFNRGSRYDYDNWAKILKDDTFAYKNMLTYFKKLENYMGDFPGRKSYRQEIFTIKGRLHFLFNYNKMSMVPRA